LSGEWVPEMATAPQPDPVVATSTATMTEGSSSGGSAKLVKEAPDAAAPIATKKAMNEATAKEAATKEAVDAAPAKWATDDVAAQKDTYDAAAAEKATEETAASRATKAEMSKEAAKKPVGSYSSPTPVVGAKRVATSSGSTPPAKRFRCSWKPRYAERLYNCFFVLCLTRVSTVSCVNHR
jgi:hypothetical protein